MSKLEELRKIVLASVELNRLLPHNFRVTDYRPDEARHLKSSVSICKIDLNNKIFSLFSKSEPITCFSLLS